MVLFAGVLMVRPLLFGVHIKAPDSWKLPYQLYMKLDSITHHIKKGDLCLAGKDPAKADAACTKGLGVPRPPNFAAEGLAAYSYIYYICIRICM